MSHHCCFLWASPDHGGGAGGKEEGEGGGVEGADLYTFPSPKQVGRVGFLVGVVSGGGGGTIRAFVCGLRRERGEGREGLRRVDFDRIPAAEGLGDLCILEAEETWDGGAGEVDVEDADGLVGKREGEGELGCYGRFTNAALA